MSKPSVRISQGTLVGTIAATIIPVTASSTAPPTLYVFDFGADNQKPVTLRGVAQGLAVNLNGIANSGSMTYRIVWREI